MTTLAMLPHCVHSWVSFAVRGEQFLVCLVSPRLRMNIELHTCICICLQAYVQGGRSQTPPFTSRTPSSVDPGQSGGSSNLRGGASHPHTAPSAVGTAEQPELSSNSHLASRPASVSHRSQPSHPGETEESVPATPTSQHNGPGEFLPSSYGTHTTLPQFFQPSAFSTADDPVWAHSSWQQHEALHSGLPPTYPHGCAPCPSPPPDRYMQHQLLSACVCMFDMPELVK